MNGPFFVERAISSQSTTCCLPADDELIGPLVVARLVAACRLAPRGHRMTSAGGLAFAAAVRMVDRVHGHAAVGRANAQPAVASGLADRNVLVIGVADLADRRHALHQHLAGLAGRQLQQRVVAFLRHQLRLSSGRARHLRALARPQLDVVHRGAGGNVLQRQRIADQDVGLRTADDLLRPPSADRLQDVALLAVGIVQQRDARRAVRDRTRSSPPSPGMPTLSRLKSMMRSFRLCPPPWCQMVRSPELRRPPVRCFDLSQRLVRLVRSSGRR